MAAIHFLCGFMEHINQVRNGHLSEWIGAIKTLPASLTRFQAVLIAASILTSIVMILWWITRANRMEKLSTLYTSASGGDLDSVRRLNEFSFLHASPWLEALAHDRTAAPDSRVAAIKALASNTSFERTRLLPLIQIDQPFVVRHTAAEVFEQKGCSDTCISATLYGLHAIWKGDPAFEEGLSAVEQKYGIRADPKVKASIKANTERDYRTLLNSNPCTVRDTLKRDYGSESAFAEAVTAHVKPCSH